MIEIKNLSKSYGKTTVFDNINLTINKGSIYTLLGKNGVGKTTLIHSIVDLIKPSKGEITIDGKAHNQLSKSDKSNIGIVGEDLALIEELNGFEYLNFIGKIYQLPHATIQKRIQDLFSFFFEKEGDVNKSIAKYSTGMKKKIAFCSAVMHTPDLLILDEPFSGLDPLVANQMIDFLKVYMNDNRTLFISSHDLSYVEKISTHIGVLDQSQLQFDSTLEDFTQNGIHSIDDALLSILKPKQSDNVNLDWI